MTFRLARRANQTEQIPEIIEIVERGLAAGLDVVSELPDVTPYATAGVSVARPNRHPPPTLIVQYIKCGEHRDWQLAEAAYYGTHARTETWTTTDPTELNELVDLFFKEVWINER